MEDKNKKEFKEKEVVKIVLDELTDRGLIRKNINTYETTKDLLRNLNKIEKSIDFIQEQIEDLNSTARILNDPKVPSAIKYDDIQGEKLVSIRQIDEKIDELKQSKVKIKAFIKYVRNIMKKALNDDDYQLADKFYFKKVDVIDLSIEYKCDDSTIYRKLNKIINSLKVEIFPEKYIAELYS